MVSLTASYRQYHWDRKFSSSTTKFLTPTLYNWIEKNAIAFGHCNVNSIRNKFKELNLLLSQNHENANFSLITFKTEFELFVEINSFDIELPFRKKFLFICIYLPPNNKQSFLKNFQDLLLELECNKFKLIIVGDLNKDLLQKSTISFEFFNKCKSFNLWQKINSPTRITENTATLIYHIFVNDL